MLSRPEPCAACKFHRRRCTPECIFAPHFPPEDPQKFANVHKVYGASNVSKILSSLHPAQRKEAAISLVFEAECRLRDPVYGSAGYIGQLQQKLQKLQIDTSKAKAELATYIGPSALLPTFPQHPAYNNNDGAGSSQQPQQNVGNPPPAIPFTNLICDPTTDVYGAGSSQQRQQMVGNPPSAIPFTNLISDPTTDVYGAGSSQQQQWQQMVGNPPSALPYTNMISAPAIAVYGAGSSQQRQRQQMVGNPPSGLPYANMISAPMIAVYGAGSSQQQQAQQMAWSNSALALPYTSLMPSGGLGAVAVAAVPLVMIREQQEQLQHGVVDPMIQQYSGAVLAGAATIGDHGQHDDDQLLRNYDQQQLQDQYELQSGAAVADHQDEIGAAGPSLALGLNIDQNPYNKNQIHDHQQQEHDDA